MKLVIFGLTVSSSWGNGHATLWRGLCSALADRGHSITFLERDVPYYANARDLTELPGGGELILYQNWSEISTYAKRLLRECDVAIATSYCPDGIVASESILDCAAGLRVFYDLDAPVTLARLARGQPVAYVGPNGYHDFDLVLSYTGGETAEALRHVLGAEHVVPLYGSVDPAVHKPVLPVNAYRGHLSYMGTYSPDRDDILRALLIEPAEQAPDERFVIGGSQYDGSFPWLPNIFYVGHLTPAQHGEFYCSSRMTLNVTRQPMAQMGFCPSGRLFEAAACGVPVLSDSWAGLEEFYTPGSEILIARNTDEALSAMSLSDAELLNIGKRARQRTLDCHTAAHRAAELEQILEIEYSRRELKAAVCGE